MIYFIATLEEKEVLPSTLLTIFAGLFHLPYLSDPVRSSNLHDPYSFRLCKHRYPQQLKWL